MALLLRNALILHIPKTGSDWVRKACSTAVEDRVHDIGDWHCDLAEALRQLEQKGLSVPLIGTFVRHPLEWYRSGWTYWRETGRFPRGEDDPRVECDDFNQFVRNCMDVAPEGYVTSLYNRFIGRKLGDVSFIGRQENLVEDLARFLSLAGERFDHEKLRLIPRANVRGGRPDSGFPGYSHELAGEVLRREQEIIRRFYP